MPFRPTDWTGTKNNFVEDRVLNANDPENRVVILEHRPFFEGVKVFRAGTPTPLSRGVDYELVYELPELEGVAFGKVFCGVNFINPSVGGVLRFEGAEVSGEFHTHFVEILDKLVKYVNTPPDLQWLNVDDRPALVPQEKSANSWYDYLNKKYLASAIRDVNISADDANADLTQKLEALKALVTDLQNEVTAFNYKAHIDNPMAHEPTCAQVGAHPANRDAPRSMMAYGRTLLELTREIRAQGLQQSDIDRYIAHYATGDVTGSFVQELSPNRALFRSNDGSSEVIFTSTDFTIRSKGMVVLSASTDFDDTIRFIEWRSGSNKLRIESSGNKLGMDKIFLNDRVLLNTYSVLDYQATGSSGSTDPDDNKLYIEGRNGISFTGKGSKADPVKGSFKAPKATKTVPGAAKLKTGPGTEVDGFAATPASLAPYTSKVQEYVPKSTLLNGKPMDDGSRTIDRTSLGLGSANNTADLAKPLSNPQVTTLDGLSPKSHTHEWGGISLLPANHEMAGITKYTASLDGAAPNKGIVPSILQELSSRLDALGVIFAEIDTTAATDFSIIDGSSWTVASTKRSLTVKDMRYFYLLDNKRKEGRVSGTIDLETTPMFKWFSPDNKMEQTWPQAITRPVTGVSWDMIPVAERPDIPFRGEAMALPDYEFGSLSIVSLLSKFVVTPASNRLGFYIVGGGKVTLYIDGQETLSADKVLGAVITTVPNVPVCIGIRVDCNDPAVSAAMLYEVFDGGVPIVISRPGNRLAKLQEFVITPFGIKHHLYLNMDTSALFSRAEPVNSSGIDVRYALIGSIDVPAGGLVGSITFQKQLDFGQSVEVSQHIENPHAHDGASIDYKIVDSVVEALGKLDFLFDYKIVGSGRKAASTGGALKLTREANGVTELVTKVKGQSPYFWMTPKNPKALGHPTIEGGLLVDSYSTDDLTLTKLLDYKLTLGNKSVGSAPGTCSGIVLSLNITDPVVFRRHDDFGAGETLALLGNLASTATTVKPTVIKEWTNADLSIIGLPPKMSSVNRLVVKYRYDIKLNTLRVFTARYAAGESSIRLLELEYKFGFDAFGLLGGYVGVSIPTDTVDGNLCLMPAPMLIGDPSFDINKYAFYRSLFESYVDSATLAPKGKVHDVVGRRAADWADYTEVMSTSKASGQPFFYNNRFPQFLRPFEIPYPVISSTPIDTVKWCRPISMENGRASALGGTFGPIGVLFETNGEYTLGKVVAKYTTYHDGALLFIGKKPLSSKQLTLTAQAVSDKPTVTTTEAMVSASDGCGVSRMLLTFTTPVVAGMNVPVNCNYVFEMYDTAGTLRETFTNAEPRPIYSLGSRGDLYSCNPYHMTSLAWDEIKAIMVEERKASKETFGNW